MPKDTKKVAMAGRPPKKKKPVVKKKKTSPKKGRKDGLPIGGPPTKRA